MTRQFSIPKQLFLHVHSNLKFKQLTFTMWTILFLLWNTCTNRNTNCSYYWVQRWWSMATNGERLLLFWSYTSWWHWHDRLVFFFRTNIRDTCTIWSINSSKPKPGTFSAMFLPRTTCKWSFVAGDRGHTHLIVFMHVCSCYSRVTTISFAEIHLQLLFEGGY